MEFRLELKIPRGPLTFSGKGRAPGSFLTRAGISYALTFAVFVLDVTLGRLAVKYSIGMKERDEDIAVQWVPIHAAR